MKTSPTTALNKRTYKFCTPACPHRDSKEHLETWARYPAGNIDNCLLQIVIPKWRAKFVLVTLKPNLARIVKRYKIATGMCCLYM